MAQPAAAPADPPSALLEAARSIRAVLARGLSARRAPTAASKENASVPSAGSPLLAKFRALQTDVAEQDKVVAALRGMLRRARAPDAAIDACIDKALFPGVDPLDAKKRHRRGRHRARRVPGTPRARDPRAQGRARAAR